MSRIVRRGEQKTVKILSGTTASEMFRSDTFAFARVYWPAALSGTVYTIQVSHDGITWFDARDEQQTTMQLTAAASKSDRISDASFPAKFMRIVSDTAEAADRDLIIEQSS